MSEPRWVVQVTPKEELNPSYDRLLQMSKEDIVRLLLTIHRDDLISPYVVAVVEGQLDSQDSSQKVYDTAKLVRQMYEDCDPLVREWYDRPLEPEATEDTVSNKDTFDGLLKKCDKDYLARMARTVLRKIATPSRNAMRAPTSINVVTNSEDASTPLHILFVTALALNFADSSGKTVRRLLMGPRQCTFRGLLLAILQPEDTRFRNHFMHNHRGECPQELLDFRLYLLQNAIAAKLRQCLESNSNEGEHIANLPDRHDPLEICDDAAWRWFAKLLTLVALTHSENKLGVPHPQVNITLMIHCFEKCSMLKELNELKKSDITKRQPSGHLLDEMAPLAAKTDNTQFYGNYWSSATLRANKRGRMDGCGTGPTPATLDISHVDDAPKISDRYCYFCGGEHTSRCPWPHLLHYLYILPNQVPPHRTFTKGAWGEWTPADILGIKFGFKK